MNDIEKNFQESLRQHEVAPPSAVWDQLNANLAQKRKKKVLYWRVAAAVALLLLGTGTLILLLRSEPTVKTMSQQEKPAAPNSEELTMPLAERSEATDSVPVAVPSDAEQVALLAPTNREEVTEEKQSPPDTYQQADARPSQSAETATQSAGALSAQQPERPRVAALPPTVPEVIDTPQPTATVPEMLPSAQVRPDRSTSQGLAASNTPPTAAVAQRRTVTVIYKPGNRSSKATETDQEDKFLSKTLSFLEDVKKNGLTYSELRSAKSELIGNVFSRDRTNQQ